MRIVRICTDSDIRDRRLEEWKNLLLEQNYVQRSIDSAIIKARSIARHIALRKINGPRSSDRPAFAIQFDPRLPSISQIQSKHWTQEHLKSGQIHAPLTS